ncbi:MAG TPA: hypothetical protein VFI54_04380 [Solirubrobacteraceae bacterium]|nr:hypothetical protein [Solirubrobacteraceae bacterium]
MLRKAARQLSLAAMVTVVCCVFAGGASAALVHTRTVQSGPGVPGTSDPNVQASFDGSSWFQAFNVAPNPGWSSIAGSGWDSVYSDGGFNGTGGIITYYRTSLTPANAVNPTISGQFLADDQGAASGRGTQLGQNGSCADQVAGFTTPLSFSGSLPSGANSLLFTVVNCTSFPTSNPTGVDFTATVSYTLAPTSTGDCKSGGWQNYTDNKGSPFKNQGDCMTYVATARTNLTTG